MKELWMGLGADGKGEGEGRKGERRTGFLPSLH